MVPVSAALEAQIADMPDEDKQLFLEDLGMDEPGLNRVVRAAYGLLGLQTYFTAGLKEVRAWTVRAGATAPQAAGVIHTDFERGFIRAEVASYDDFVSCGGEQGEGERQAPPGRRTTRCATATLSTSGSTYDRSEVRSGEKRGPAAPRRAAACCSKSEAEFAANPEKQRAGLQAISPIQ